MSKDKTELLPQKHSLARTAGQVLKFLSSMQLGIVLLLLLAAVSVLATLREQGAEQSIYRSWWYLGIMAFTAFNLFLCTVKRIKPLTRQAFSPQKTQTAETVSKMPAKKTIALTDDKTEEEAVALAADVFRRHGLKPEIIVGSRGMAVFAQKDVCGFFGSLLAHTGLLIILLGAMIGALTGFEKQGGGIVGDRISVPEGNFAVRITDMWMEFAEDPTVRPRVYSEVMVTEGGREIAGGVIAINQPLRFGGNTIYHTTFRYVSEVAVRNLETGETKSHRVWDRDSLPLEENGLHIHFLAFFPNFTTNAEGIPYSKNYLPENPVLAGILYDEKEKPQSHVYLPLNEPVAFSTAGGELEITLIAFQNAVVYTITRNLGRPVLVFGAVVFILGLYLCFSRQPRRFWAVYDRERATLFLGGRSYRGRFLLERELTELANELKRRGEEEHGRIS